MAGDGTMVSVLIEAEPKLRPLVLTRFPHANRDPPRIKRGVGFRSTTLQIDRRTGK